MSYIQKDPLGKKETWVQTMQQAVPMPFRIGTLAVLILIVILLLFFNKCGGDDLTSEDGVTLTEQLSDATKIIDEKIAKIKLLKESGTADKEVIEKLETEVTGLKTILKDVEDELDNMNTGSQEKTIQTRKKVLAAIQKANTWDEATEKQIVKISGNAIKNIKDSLRFLDSEYLIKLEAKNAEIAKLKSELQAAKNNNKNESNEIKTLNARIKALENQVEELTIKNGRLEAENIELRASLAKSVGDVALVAQLNQDLDAQKIENRKIAALTNKLEKVENVVNKTGGLQVYYLDKHDRKIKIDDADATRRRDVSKIEVNYTNTNWDDTPLEIMVLGRNGTAPLSNYDKIDKQHSMKNYILTPIYKIENSKLPKGDYTIIIKNITTNETVEKPFTVQRNF